MKIILYHIILSSKDRIKVRKKFLWFYIFKMVEQKYEYWIEFRVDEKRFWYGERKPIWNSELDCYEIKTNYVMTKNGCERSLEIIDGIKLRTADLCPAFNLELNFKHPEYMKFKRYDKVVPQDNYSNATTSNYVTKEEYREGLKGMFLSD